MQDNDNSPLKMKLGKAMEISPVSYDEEFHIRVPRELKQLYLERASKTHVKVSELARSVLFANAEKWD